MNISSTASLRGAPKGIAHMIKAVLEMNNRGFTPELSIFTILADGKFLGADTQHMFDQVVAEDNAKKKLFSDLTGLLAAGQGHRPQANFAKLTSDEVPLAHR